MEQLIIIGAGPVGTGAARHAAHAGMAPLIIAPYEGTRADHTVWSSHYDQGRLTHRSARNVTLARYALEAISNYRAIEAESGIDFYTPCGTLSLSPDPRGFSYTQQRADIEAALAFTYVDYTPAQLHSQFPVLRTNLPYYGMYDAAPSGFINPRAMVAAQQTCAIRRGARRIDAVVDRLDTHADYVELTTTAGDCYRAERVIVAAGAYNGLYGLLPTPVAHTIKSELITLAEVDAHTATTCATQAMPSMMIDCSGDIISDAYLIPPVQYPDGKYYCKIGSNSIHDTFFDTAPALHEWIASGHQDATHHAQIRLLHELFGDMEWRSFHTLPCVITRTPSKVPEIARVHARVTALVGCNGSLAKSGDTVGRLLVEQIYA